MAERVPLPVLLPVGGRLRGRGVLVAHLRRLTLLASLCLATTALPGLVGASKPVAGPQPKGVEQPVDKPIPSPAERGVDVKDTHDRLDRIYTKLGYDRSPPKAVPEPQGCGCDEGRKRGTARRGTQPFRPPVLPPVLGWLLVGLVIAAMLVPLILALRNTYRDVSKASSEEHADTEQEGAEPLPMAGPWRVSLDECRRLVAAGRLAEAYAALHRLTLVALERAGHLSLDATITNWEYVRRLLSRPPLRELLAEVTIAAERSVLGRSPPDATRFGELERLVLQRLEGVS